MAGTGGKRPGAGRKKGTTDAVKREVLEKAAKGGIMPLDYMLKVLRDENALVERRDDMAKAAAPYLHKKQPQAMEAEFNGKIMVGWEK